MEYEYCKCGSNTLTSGFEEDFGFWDVCAKCGKRIEDGYHYYKEVQKNYRSKFEAFYDV